MTTALLAASIIIFSCVIFNKISSRLGVPMLLAFILLGMFFGSDGPVRIQFEDYFAAEQVCSVALIFIMFYGGFGTNWNEARPVAVKAILLSSLGTVTTAGLVGLFCHFVLRIALLESFLIGAVICSTDAASVFSILRSRKLNLKYNTASLLEVESGSNDPFSYMLTVIVLSLMNGGTDSGGFGYMLFAQIVYGVGFGIVMALLALTFMRRFKFAAAGFDAIFIFGVALLAYAAPTYIGGNGYLSAYIAGIILGNSRIPNKRSLVHFFDAITGLMQLLLFFLLGLTASPSQLPGIAFIALAVALFLTFVARPAAVFAILAPFKSNVQQMLLVSWSGMRGAASIVFAIMAVINPAVTDNDIFHIVFFIVLFSILLQGTLIPLFARLLHMTDSDSDVMKTFTDYAEDLPVEFIQFTMTASHPWTEKAVRDLTLPPDSLLVLLIRGTERIVPNGGTILLSGDTIILSGKTAAHISGVTLYERVLSHGDARIGKSVSEIPAGEKLIIMIQRNGSVVIPKGSTTLMENDILVVNDPESVD